MSDPLQLGRYSLFAKLASGGMATVYLGRLNGEVGFGRIVAIKRLHPHLASEPDFVSMFLDEAHLAARVRHPNVVPTLDVVTTDHELFLVMEYVRGESLGSLLRTANHAGESIPIPIVASALMGVLNGLHAAHEAEDEHGAPLEIVHRDVSPQNVFLGADGVTRVLDFGVAKAATRLQTTHEGQLKGKLSYMPPEQVHGVASRRTDIYSAGVVLWEALACRRLYTGDTDAQILAKVMEAAVKPPSRYNQAVPAELDRVVMKALARDPGDRYRTAQEMAEEIDAAVRPASSVKVAEWVARVAAVKLAARDALVAQVESGSSPHSGPHAERFLRSLPTLDPSESGQMPIPPASDARLNVGISSFRGVAASEAPSYSSTTRGRKKPRRFLAVVVTSFVGATLLALTFVVGASYHPSSSSANAVSPAPPLPSAARPTDPSAAPSSTPLPPAATSAPATASVARTSTPGRPAVPAAAPQPGLSQRRGGRNPQAPASSANIDSLLDTR
jgi:eukaryotic-like serine/threonine-protein kinase